MSIVIEATSVEGYAYDINRAGDSIIIVLNYTFIVRYLKNNIIHLHCDRVLCCAE